MPRLLRRLAALSCALLLVAGCGEDDPRPRVSPTPTTTAAVTSAPPPTTSAPPTETVAPVVDSPRGVVRRWIRLYNRLLTDGDGREIRSISRTCEPCRELTWVIEDAYAAGGGVQGGTWRPLSLENIGRSGVLVGVVARIRSDPSVLRRSENASPREFTGGRLDIEFNLTLASGRWAVDYLVEKPP